MCLQFRRPWFHSWVGKIPWGRDRQPTPVFLGFPCGSAGKESACHAGNLGLIPGLGRSTGGGNGNPLQYSGLENSVDRGAWRATACGVAESDTTEQLSTAQAKRSAQRHGPSEGEELLNISETEEGLTGKAIREQGSALW